MQSERKSINIIEIMLPLTLIMHPYYIKNFNLLSVGYILVVIQTIYLVLKKDLKIKNISIIIIILLMIFLSFMTLLNTPIYSNLQVLTDTIKLLLFGIYLVLLSNYKFNYEKFYKNMVVISLLAIAFLMFQIIMNKVGVKIPNGFDFFIIEYQGSVSTEYSTYRPASFYFEPAYFSAQILITFILVYFNKNKKTLRIILLILFLYSIVMSTSSGGIFISLILLLLIFLMKNINVLIKVVVVSMFLLVFYNFDSILELASNTGLLSKQIIYSIEKIKHLDSITRFGASYERLEGIQGWRLLSGYGIGNEYYYIGEVTYVNSVTRIIIQSGLVGLFIYFLFVIRVTKTNFTKAGFLLIVTYVIKVITGNAAFSLMGLLILSTALMMPKTNKKSKGVKNEFKRI